MTKNYQTEYRKIQEELDRISQELESDLDEDFEMQWQPEDIPREALDLSQYKDLESFWNAKRSIRSVLH